LLQLIHIYCGGLPFMAEVIRQTRIALRDTDLLVGSYFYPHFRAIAEKAGVPFATFAFCHNLTPTDLHPPAGLPHLRGLPSALRRPYCRVSWKISNQIVDFALNSICRSLFREHGLPPMRGFLLEPAELELVAVAKVFAENWRPGPRFQFTGYLRWQSPPNPRLEQELLEFCAGEPVPVLTFGSVTFDDVHVIMDRFLRHWPAGRKIIIQSGWAGLSVDVAHPHIKIIGSVSHDQLFRHASCVIHHGGAGTTASVLFAGKPHIIIPHIADQFFWGAEIKRLRVGLVLNKKVWPEKLPAKLAKIEAKKKIRRRAAELGARIRAEEGPATAVRLLEEFVARQPARSVPEPVAAMD
ncbi:MAG: glycosyltransferase, partial [Opitutales bacterium]